MANPIVQPVTISTLADELKLSKSTVSFVLSGKAKERQVAAKTASRVEEMALKLGYAPNQMARSLRRQRSGVITTLFGHLEMNWANAVMKGISGVFKNSDYTSFLAVDWADPKILLREVQAILQRKDEGVISYPSYSPDAMKKYSLLIERGLPLVFVGDLQEQWANAEGVNTVIWDDEPAVKMAVRYLIDTGRRKIGFVGSRHGVISDMRRFRAYQSTLVEAGLPFRQEWCVWASLKQIGLSPQECIRQLFSVGNDRPDAIFALNDSIGIAAIEGFDAMGIRIPDDVAIMGVGDMMISRYRRINLTTIVEPLEELGKVAAETILELIERPSSKPIHKVVNCCELKIRTTA